LRSTITVGEGDHTQPPSRSRRGEGSGPITFELPVIDLHSHVLSGIDDGPDSIEGSIELARAAQAAGASMLMATPHVSWRYPNDADTIARLVDELNARLGREGLTLTVRTGGEIAMTRLLDTSPDELSRLGYAGGPWLLVEPPFVPAISGLDTLLLDLKRRGHRILLAHPERCQAFHHDRRMLETLVHGGVLTSVTAGSLVGRFGDSVRRFAVELVRDELVHNVASDAHDHTNRPPGMAAELEQAGLTPLSDWLTRQVPEAILEDREIPPRPVNNETEAIRFDVGGTPRRWWRRRR
jgi:protein-tyrosine phosphatase